MKEDTFRFVVVLLLALIAFYLILITLTLGDFYNVFHEHIHELVDEIAWPMYEQVQGG